MVQNSNRMNMCIPGGRVNPAWIARQIADRQLLDEAPACFFDGNLAEQRMFGARGHVQDDW